MTRESDNPRLVLVLKKIKLRLLVTETSRNRKKKENRGKIDSHQARLFAKKRKPVEYLL